METKEQSKIKKLMKSKPAKAGVSVALVGTLALAGIGAYFTGTDTVENKFDISAGLTDKITVVEENWDTTDADTNGIPDAAEHVVPLQTIAKDPVVKNESDVEAWLFCQIKVPTANVSVVGEDGTPEAAASHELFTYTVNEGWTESGTPVVADGYTTHTYLYNTKVAANSQTARSGFVWEPVTGDIDNAKWKVPSPDPDDDTALMTYCGAEGSVLTEMVTAHAIQAKNFEPDFEAASPWGDVEVEGADVSASKEAQ